MKLYTINLDIGRFKSHRMYKDYRISKYFSQMIYSSRFSSFFMVSSVVITISKHPNLRQIMVGTSVEHLLFDLCWTSVVLVHQFLMLNPSLYIFYIQNGSWPLFWSPLIFGVTSAYQVLGWCQASLRYFKQKPSKRTWSNFMALISDPRCYNLWNALCILISSNNICNRRDCHNNQSQWR